MRIPPCCPLGAPASFLSPQLFLNFVTLKSQGCLAVHCSNSWCLLFTNQSRTTCFYSRNTPQALHMLRWYRYGTPPAVKCLFYDIDAALFLAENCIYNFSQKGEILQYNTTAFPLCVF